MSLNTGDLCLGKDRPPRGHYVELFVGTEEVVFGRLLFSQF